MNEFLLSPYWFFITLGGILLIIELLGSSGYSLWSGVSALIVGFIAYLLPISWSYLWVLFAVFTLLTAYLWYLWLKKNDRLRTKKQTLNQPQNELLGMTVEVVEAIHHGRGRVKIKDSTWSATCDDDIDIGQWVTVNCVDGIILRVVKAD